MLREGRPSLAGCNRQMGLQQEGAGLTSDQVGGNDVSGDAHCQLPSVGSV